MFDINFKSISLFLTLLVLIVGIVGVVFAEDINVGFIHVGITNATNFNVTHITGDTASSAEDVELVTIVSNETSQSKNGHNIVKGTGIVMAEGLDLVFDGKVYKCEGNNNYTPVKGVVVSTNNILNDDIAGHISGTVKIISGASRLNTSSTYYVGIIVPAGAQAIEILTEDSSIVASVEKNTTLFVPFIYN